MEIQTMLERMDRRYAVFGQLFQINNRLQAIANRYLGEITVKQWFFLACLSSLFPTPPSLTELGEAMGCSRQNVKQLALKLAEKGLIQLLPDERDRRTLRVHMTAQMTAYGAESVAWQEAFISRLFSALDKRELDGTFTALIKLENALAQLEREKEEGQK
ncbi:MarR family transcriptional regulator [Eubacteriales bacterium OttesenSCG-928-M02]|nr:MarR family transcriptional regulator [Eubacteriales bacterium OttesenSCG-928-M02]